MDAIEFWRLHDTLTVAQAAMLALGLDPAQFTKAPGFEPLSKAIGAALLAGQVEGAPQPDGMGFVDLDGSTVDVASLRQWFDRRGTSVAFFDRRSPHVPDYLQQDHPNRAFKLVAAVGAWQAIQDEALTAGTSPRKAAEAWLTANANRLGLVLPGGEPNGTAIVGIAKVVNWKTEGGAPRTPSRTPPK